MSGDAKNGPTSKGGAVTCTIGELLGRGLWHQAADLLGIFPWAVNTGQMDTDTEVTLTAEQAAHIGL